MPLFDSRLYPRWDMCGNSWDLDLTESLDFPVWGREAFWSLRLRDSPSGRSYLYPNRVRFTDWRVLRAGHWYTEVPEWLYKRWKEIPLNVFGDYWLERTDLPDWMRAYVERVQWPSD